MEYALTGMQSDLSDDLELKEDPMTNVFSGTDVTVNLGEGILNFVYADFLVPAKDCLKPYVFIESLRKKHVLDDLFGAENHNIEQNTASNDPQKVYNHLQMYVEEYYDYVSTFSEIRDIAYASLYSAIFPPVFTDIKLNPKNEIQIYASYLLALQKEYLELLEFCFDQDYFPELLEDMTPGERYAAYRHMHNMSSDIKRNEVFHMDGNIDKDGSRGGMSSGSYISRLYSTLFEKDDTIFRGFADKYSLSIYEVRSLFARPRSIYIDYGVNTVAGMLELELSKMIEENIHFRKCKRCGKYFIVKGNYNTNYCSRIADGETRSCQELAAMETYKKKVADVPAMAIYQRYYKRYKARERVNQIKKDDFNKWKYKAMDKREDCLNGRITPAAFEEWLEGCFPNRHKKD